MLKLKLQFFGHLMWRADSLEKTLMLGKIEIRRRKGWQRMRWFDGILNSVGMNLSKLQETVKDGEAWHAAVLGVTKSQTWLSNWTAILAAVICVWSDKYNLLLLFYRQKRISERLNGFLLFYPLCLHWRSYQNDPFPPRGYHLVGNKSCTIW